MINAWIDGCLSLIVALVAIDLRVLTIAGVLCVAVWTKGVGNDKRRAG